MSADLQPRLLTLEQAAAYLSLPMTEVRRRAIGAVHFGARIRFDRVALDAYLDEQRGVSAHEPDRNDNDPEAALERFTRRFAHVAGRS
jgi:hypothetical protein